MPKRRIKSKRKADRWPADIDFDVMVDLHLGFGDVLTDDDMARSAWMAYRNQILTDSDYTDTRPWGWWKFESTIDPEELKGMIVKQWEFLYFLNELDPAELKRIKNNWIENLPELKWSLQYVLKTGKYAGLVYCPYDVACERFKRQADLLGDEAVKAWESFINEVEKEVKK